MFRSPAFLYCMLKLFNFPQMPDALVSAGQSRSAEEKLRDSQELESLRQKEHAAKRSRTFQRGTRCNFSWNHSRRITADKQSQRSFEIFVLSIHRKMSWCFPFRHSRFGGSYVVQGVRSIGENDLIYHRNLNNVSSDLLQFKKRLIDL